MALNPQMIKPVLAAAAALAASVAPAHAAYAAAGDAGATASSDADATAPAAPENKVSDPATIPWTVVKNSFSSG